MQNLCEGELFGDFPDAACPRFHGDATGFREKGEKTRRRHVEVERAVFGKVPDSYGGLPALARKIEPGHADRSRGRGEEPRKNFHGGGFSRAVGTEEGGDLSTGHGESDVLDGSETAVVLGEADRLDHRGGLIHGEVTTRRTLPRPLPPRLPWRLPRLLFSSSPWRRGRPVSGLFRRRFSG